jgi:Bacterial PH domain
MRLLCAVGAAVVVGVAIVVALSLKSSSTGVVEFRTDDQVAIFGLGLVIGAAIMALGWSRVDADADGVRIRNILVRHELPWTAVRAVSFARTSSWATLQLENDDEVAVLAVQAADKERAVRAVEALRALHAARRAQDPAPPPLLYPE